MPARKVAPLFAGERDGPLVLRFGAVGVACQGVDLRGDVAVEALDCRRFADGSEVSVQRRRLVKVTAVGGC